MRVRDTMTRVFFDTAPVSSLFPRSLFLYFGGAANKSRSPVARGPINGTALQIYFLYGTGLRAPISLRGPSRLMVISGQLTGDTFVTRIARPSSGSVYYIGRYIIYGHHIPGNYQLQSRVRPQLVLLYLPICFYHFTAVSDIALSESCRGHNKLFENPVRRFRFSRRH